MTPKKFHIVTVRNQIHGPDSDGGIGIPEGLDIEMGDTLGLQLVKGLAEEQLEGTLELLNTPGTTWCLKF